MIWNLINDIFVLLSSKISSIEFTVLRMIVKYKNMKYKIDINDVIGTRYDHNNIEEGYLVVTFIMMNLF